MSSNGDLESTVKSEGVDNGTEVKKGQDTNGKSPRGSREASPSREIAASDPKRSTPKIVITKMSMNVTVDHLREICSMWGTVEDIRFEVDGEKTCAVVTFSKRTEAQDALDHMHRMTFDHCEIVASFTVDEDPRTAIPLSAYGQVSHKEDNPRGRRGNEASGTNSGDSGARRGQNKRRRSPSRGSHERGRSPSRHGDYPPRRYDDYNRPPPSHYRRYDDRDRPPPQHRRDDRDYGRYDDRRSYYGRPRSPSPDSRRDARDARDRSPQRYGSPEPKRSYHGASDRPGFR